MKKKTPKPLKLRFGIGEEEGFTSVKVFPDEPGCVEAIYSSFHFHRLTPAERYEFMNGAFEVLKPGAQISFVAPHWSSMRAVSDPLAQWPPLCESSFAQYNKAFREREGLTDLPLTCDFDIVYGYGHTMDPEYIGRNDEFVNDAKKHALNAITDLHVTMTKPLTDKKG